ncbi:MAG: Ig-like domain repeat protein [Candidatus Sulfotelmatobacter sp.]
MNGDGKPDLVVTGCSASCSPGNVAVLLGNGDGSFKPGVLYSTGGWVAGALAVADVNLDGKADIVVVNACKTVECTGVGSLGVMLGKGDGTFEPVVTYGSGGFEASAIAIADVNGDGNPDLLVANGCNPNSCTTYDYSHEVGVLLGRGDGTFRSVVSYASGGFSADSISAIDLNGDGVLDLVVGNESATATASDSNGGILLGNGDGTFQTATSYDAGGIFAPGLTVLDVNGDGEPDLIMTGFCAPNSVGCVTTGANLYAILGNGNGTFQPGEILYMLGDYGGREALLVGDLNDDGKPDLVLVHGCELLCPLDDVEVGVMLNNSGAPATTIALTSDKNPVSLFATVTYTATVAGGSGGTIDGTVTFADGDAPVATATMSTNRATYSTTYKKAGSHLMRATYSGVLHTAEGSRSVALTQNVVDPTKTVLATSGSPSFVGQPVTFSAAVTSAYGVIPSGELVKFYDQNTLLASVALSGGKATYTTSNLTAKKHGMQAIYAGDSMFATSTGYLAQVVELYSTTTTITCSPNPSSFGQKLTITAVVKSSGPVTPTGRVTFRDGTTWIGAGTLSGGVATMSKSNLAAGTHPITATYDGDSNSAQSTSVVVNQVVN